MITCRPEGTDEDIRLIADLMPESGFTRRDVPPGRYRPGQRPGAEFADLYHDRREEETIFGEIKTRLCGCPAGRDLQRAGRRGATVNRPVVFRSKTPDRVVQELLGILTAYNAIRKTMYEAARRKDLDARRVSFVAATERPREATYEMMRLPTARLPARYEEMLAALRAEACSETPGQELPPGGEDQDVMLSAQKETTCQLESLALALAWIAPRAASKSAMQSSVA